MVLTAGWVNVCAWLECPCETAKAESIPHGKSLHMKIMSFSELAVLTPL